MSANPSKASAQQTSHRSPRPEEDVVLCEYVCMGMGSTGEADIKYRFFLLSGKRVIVDVNTEALADQGRSIYFCLGIQGRLLGEVTPLINLEA